MTAINITFLGTGAAIPTLKRGHTTIHLNYQGKSTASILLDCGEGTQTQLVRAGISFMGIDMIFISHWHADHFIGMYGLLNSMGLEGRTRGIAIFGPGADKIGPKLMEFYHFPFKIGFFDSYKDGKILETDEFIIEAAKMKHTIEDVAYKFTEKGRLKLDKEKIKKLGLTGLEAKELKEKGKLTKDGRKISLKDVSYLTQGKTIVYSGDTMFLKKMEKFAKGVDILIHDCTSFSNDDLGDKMHTSFEDITKSPLRKTSKKIYLVHIGRKYQSHEELQKEAKKYKNIFFAKDLEKVEA
jgi:ribonuclease Z